MTDFDFDFIRDGGEAWLQLLRFVAQDYEVRRIEIDVRLEDPGRLRDGGSPDEPPAFSYGIKLHWVDEYPVTVDSGMIGRMIDTDATSFAAACAQARELLDQCGVLPS